MADFYERDINKFTEEINLFKSEVNLWRIEGAVKNSSGNLALHIYPLIFGNMKVSIIIWGR